MPPDSQNEQELMLKKRARRRLVGAIALVLLMIILLPQVLQDRAVLAQQAPIKIVMQDVVNPAVIETPAVNHSTAPETAAAVITDQSAVNDVPAQTLPELPPAVEQAPVADVAAVKPNIAETKINTTVTESTAKTSAVQAPTVQAPAVQAGELFTVQVGVYSDAANVKRLQEQLKQAGFVTKTEKIKTAKGESIRLRAGSYPSRQDATLALAKIKDLGLPGMVVSQ